MKIDLTDEERKMMVDIIQSTTVQIIHAEKAIALLKKFKEAK